LLEEVLKQDFIDNYSGIRVSKTGKEFMVKNAQIWNVRDAADKIIGQAVRFPKI
jgi:hypothetical protein